MCWQYSIKKRTFGFLIQNFLHVLFLKNIQSVSRRLVDAIMRWLMILQTCYCYRLSEASTILCPYSSGLGKMSDAYVLAVCDINSSISLFYMYLTIRFWVLTPAAAIVMATAVGGLRDLQWRPCMIAVDWREPLRQAPTWPNCLYWGLWTDP